jgi:N-acetylmuramoyl-L-alanine amidase
MLQILDVENSDKLNFIEKKTKKSQILLYDTKRRTDDFIKKLEFRKNGKYEDTPHFIVNKIGTVYKIFDTNYYSVSFNHPPLDKKIIKIAVENLGWLNKNTITGFLFNWIGDPYRSEPLVRFWRDKHFWDRYTPEQYRSLSELCHYLCEKHDIPKKIVPSNGYIEKISKFKGIVGKSNYSDIYTDINPSFDFRLIFENEKENIERI